VGAGGQTELCIRNRYGVSCHTKHSQYSGLSLYCILYMMLFVYPASSLPAEG
jgi:hypothetical protein